MGKVWILFFLKVLWEKDIRRINNSSHQNIINE